MILRLTPLLLLLLATIVPVVVSLVCPDLVTPNCHECKARSIVNEQLKCDNLGLEKDTYWFINKQQYVKYKPIECKDIEGTPTWVMQDGLTAVTDAECHQLCFSNNPDVTSIRRIVAPEITFTEIKCANGTQLVLSQPADTRLRRYNNSLECDFTLGSWWSIQRKKRARLVQAADKVYCEAFNDAGANTFLSRYEVKLRDDPPPAWLHPVLIAIGTAFILASIVPLTVFVTKLRNRPLPRVPDGPAIKAWNEHWNVVEEPVEWNWKVLKDYLATWDKRTNEEKIKFIEKGYSELGYKSSISQMLYLFEWMYEVEENHHHVWRPMMICLIRIKRLATPPFSDPDLMFRFNSWIAFQGKKIIDRYGILHKPARRRGGGEEKKDKKQDPHDEYLRFIGVFLMTLGNGARTKKMFEEIDALFLRESMEIPGPVRMAMGANRVARDPALFSFESVWDRLAHARPDDEPSEWGGLMDQAMYVLAFTLDEIPNDMMAEFMLKSRKIGARSIACWVRGANERGSHAHMPFLIKNATRLNVGGKMKIASEELYVCLKEYCLFDRSILAWQAVEEFVAKHDVLAKRLNVPALRRRSEHFTAHYVANGEVELDAFLSEHFRALEIEEADFVPIGKVTARPA